MNRHAPLPPSAAERWVMCPGSVEAESEAPAPGASEFADLGTKAHALFAYGLRYELSVDHLTDDPMLLRPLTLALDMTREILAGRKFMVERRLKPLAQLPAVWGTADVIAFAAAGPVDTILDLKFGEAIGVEASTLQLAIYALLAGRQFGLAESGLTAWVLQPRHDHQDGPARSHHYRPEELDQLELFLRDKAAAVLKHDAPRQAGEWCRFCAAAASCSERQAAPQAVTSLPSAFFRPPPRWFQAGSR
jgi:Protein of unknown function (DUF2800)